MSETGVGQRTESCCYGKIPTLGDFVQRGLNRRQVETWDEWLQGCLAESRRSLGDDWLDFYLEAPVWYFAAGPGNIDQQTWIGVLIPSVDRVGRYFPMSILRKFGGSPLDAMRQARDWYAEAERLALDCLDENFQSGDLEPRLGQMPQPASGVSRPCEDRDVVSDEPTGRVYLLGDSPSTNEVLSAVADDTLLQLYPGYSVWWTAGSRAVAAALLVASAMPDHAAFSAMLNGRFEEHGWDGFRRVGGAPTGAPQAAEDAASQEF